MASYVLVHGGGHGGWCWQRLAPLLRAEGHDVHTPTLTGLGERSHLVRPDTDLDTHITDVAAVLEYEDLTDVILVGHSYGGMVITGTADRVPDRIGQIVYLDAASPQNGQSLVDVAPALMDFARSDSRVVDGVDLVLWPSPDLGLLYGVTDPGDLAWMQRHLTPHPWRCFEQPLHLHDEARMRAIPRTDVVCVSELNDREAPNEDRSVGAQRVWEIETGHDLMITEPRAVADMLLRLASL